MTTSKPPAAIPESPRAVQLLFEAVRLAEELIPSATTVAIPAFNPYCAWEIRPPGGFFWSKTYAGSVLRLSIIETTRRYPLMGVLGKNPITGAPTGVSSDEPETAVELFFWWWSWTLDELEAHCLPRGTQTPSVGSDQQSYYMLRHVIRTMQTRDQRAAAIEVAEASS